MPSEVSEELKQNRIVDELVSEVQDMERAEVEGPQHTQLSHFSHSAGGEGYVI